MSCYRPLISRWRRHEHVPDTRHQHKHVQSSENHVETIRERKGVTLNPEIGPQQVTIKIGHDHSSTPHYIYDQEVRHQPRGVLSLGLPLGISSLKLGSRRRRKQKKRNQNISNTCGHQSDGETVRHRTLGLENDWYQTLTKSSHTINDQDDLIDSPISTNTSFQNANIPIAKSHYHAERKSSLPRKAKIVSGYDDLQQRKPRSLSVDADQMLQSVTREPTCVSPRVPTDTEDILKFAGLTSPTQFMMSRDKSSSGNSSGCGSDVTADTDSEWRHPPPSRSQSRSRGRAPVNVITTQGPPPRHLLPAKLKPAPGVKCHPYVLLPHQIHREFGSSQAESADEVSGCEQSSTRLGHVPHVAHRSRDASPFGKSRQNTPSISKRRMRSKSETPSPLDHGYQTLEHSYDGDSSLSSETVTTRDIPIRDIACHLLSLNDTLLTRILSHVRSSKDLVMVSTTCSRLRVLAWQPQLWTRVSFTNDVMLATDTAMRSILARLVWTRDTGHGAESVTCITLSGCTRTTDRSLALIARNCPQLRRLELQRCRNVTNGGILDLVTRCGKLNHLDLTGCPMISSIPVARSRSGSASATNLTYLDMSECSALDDTGLTMTLLNCPRLTHLYIRKCVNITDAGVRSVSHYCPQVRELSLSQCPAVSDNGLCELAKLGPSLRYLSVSKCERVSDTGLRHLVSHCYKLRYLNTRGCAPVTDATILSLTSSCSRLRSLDLGKCDVTDNGLRHLARQIPHLRKLSVRGCQLVGDTGVLAVARGCRDLVTLNMMECDVSLQAVNIVSRELRNCYIESSYHSAE